MYKLYKDAHNCICMYTKRQLQRRKKTMYIYCWKPHLSSLYILPQLAFYSRDTEIHVSGSLSIHVIDVSGIASCLLCTAQPITAYLMCIYMYLYIHGIMCCSVVHINVQCCDLRGWEVHFFTHCSFSQTFVCLN